MLNGSVKITAIPRIPDVREGDNLGMIIGTALDEAGLKLKEGDILCIAHKLSLIHISEPTRPY